MSKYVLILSIIMLLIVSSSILDINAFKSSPLIRVSVVDERGEPLTTVFINQKVWIKSELKSQREQAQNLVYIVLITDKDGFTVHLEWINETLEEDLITVIPWIPTKEGLYTVHVFFWTDIEKPAPLYINPPILVIDVSLSSCGAAPSAPGNWICRDGKWIENILQNSGFEATREDNDKTLDPVEWEVAEGKTDVIYRDGFRYGTDNVSEEWPELIQVVGEENGINPVEGVRMIKVDARLYLKTNFRQFYLEPIKEGRLTQEIYIYPATKEYLQQIEIRGTKDEGIGGKRDEEGVRGNQLFSFKYSHEKLMLVVTTGKELKNGRHIIWKEFDPLPPHQWSLVKIVLESAGYTTDEYGRTISQKKLLLYVNGELLYESGREDEPYVQYFQSADFIVIGDDYVLPEDKPPEKNKIGPTTGDSFGVVYYDAVMAWSEMLIDTSS